MANLKQLFISVALTASLLLAAREPAAAEVAGLDDVAKILAGMQPPSGSPLAAITQDASWQRHARYFDTAWTQLNQRQLSKIRIWSERNLKPQQVLLYMFSGPDYLYADAFFPDASTYVLAGLEPVGQVPDLSKLARGTLDREIEQLESSLNSVLSFSFFITKKMKEQLGAGQVTGTLPILYVFLARSGKTVESVDYVALDGDGNVHPSSEAGRVESAKGIKIGFSDAQGHKKTLYYFSTDLSNDGVRSSGFLKFCERLGPADGFTKSASYLMHSDSFSSVRDFMLGHTSAILQDDSGIPMRDFTSEWQLRPFGRYVGPISIFPGRNQVKLSELYRTRYAGALDFGIGYRWHSHESNLLLALKGEATVGAPANTPTANPQASPEAEDAKKASVHDRPAHRRGGRGNQNTSWWSGF